MCDNAPTIKTQEPLKKRVTVAKSFHSIDNMWNPTQPTDSIVWIIQEERGSQKVLHPRLCSSKSLYSTPSGACQQPQLRCVQGSAEKHWSWSLSWFPSRIRENKVQVQCVSVHMSPWHILMNRKRETNITRCRSLTRQLTLAVWYFCLHLVSLTWAKECYCEKGVLKNVLIKNLTSTWGGCWDGSHSRLLLLHPGTAFQSWTSTKDKMSRCQTLNNATPSFFLGAKGGAGLTSD